MFSNGLTDTGTMACRPAAILIWRKCFVAGSYVLNRTQPTLRRSAPCGPGRTGWSLPSWLHCRRYGSERPHQVLIQLAVHLPQYVVRFFCGERRLVSALLHQRSKHITYSHNTNEVLNLISDQTVRVSRTIDIFVMVDHHIDHLRINARSARQRLGAVLRVMFNYLTFLLGQRTRLLEYSQRDPGFADIVQHSRSSEAKPIGSRQTESLTERRCHARYKQTMLVCLAMVCADGLDPTAQALIFNIRNNGFASCGHS